MKSRGTELRVGIFVLVALVVGGGVAFIIGNQRDVFKPKTTFTAVFDDVAGLRPGSPVRVAGVTVGTVSEVEFDQAGLIEVKFTIVDSAARLLQGTPAECTREKRQQRSDQRALQRQAIRQALVEGREPPHYDPLPECSVVIIDSKGMLGDMLVDVSVGSGFDGPWDPAAPLPVGGRGGLGAMLERAEGTLDSVESTARNIRLATDPFADQQLATDLNTTAHNLAKITGMLANGDGLAQQLMTDRRMTDQVRSTLGNIDSATAELARAARSVRAITDEVRAGDGSAHELIYGDTGARAVTNIGNAAGEVATMLGEIREGEGTAHDLIYGDSAEAMLANLTQASEDVAFMTGEMRAGRGTLGGLMSDPSIYEDVKRLVGDLNRNDILRALVRYSIRRDEAAERPTVEGEEQ